MKDVNKLIGSFIRKILKKSPELIGINAASKDGFTIAHETKKKDLAELSLSHNLPYSLSSDSLVSASNSAILNVASKVYKEILQQENYYSLSIGEIGAISVWSEKIAIIGFVQEHSSKMLNFLNIAGQLQTLENCIERHRKKHKKIKKRILKLIEEKIPVFSIMAVISKEDGLPIKVRPKIDLDLFCSKISWLMNCFTRLVGTVKHLIIGGIHGQIIVNNADERRLIVIAIPPLDMDEYLSKTDTIANFFKALVEKCDETLSSLTS